MNLKPAAQDAVRRQAPWYLTARAGIIGRGLLAVYAWFCFVKLPTAAPRDEFAQTFEPVLSFAAAHRLQWGRDIIFTYGPLGFLASDHYWGRFFWPILLWSFVFSVLLTALFLRFSARATVPVRAVLYVALPFLTLPSCGGIGFDPIYFLFITLLGVGALPEEGVGMALLCVCGAAAGLLCLIKFTLCLYCLFTMLVVLAVYCLGKRPVAGAVLAASSALSFLAAWFLAGQGIANLPLYFQRGWQIASAYSSGMALSPPAWGQILGVALLLCLMASLGLCRRASPRSWLQTARSCLVGAGIFLAWKEGFMRADYHVFLFLIYAFLIAALMPALFKMPEKGQRWLLPLTLGSLFLCVAPCVVRPQVSPGWVAARLLGKRAETVEALFTPGAFKADLGRQLDSMRAGALLPRICAEAAEAPVGVLGYDHDVALLNGLNFRPHPVFQNLCCSSPELQRLNAAFFSSPNAPEYVLWRYRTIDFRFPTLDDGEVVPRVLASYSPVVREGAFVLWKKNPAAGSGYRFGEKKESAVFTEQWVQVPDQPTWMQIELRETWAGAVGRFLCRGAMPFLDVELQDGQLLRYRLPPGNAAAGFLVNPLLRSNEDMTRWFSKPGDVPRVAAVRVHFESGALCFDDAIRIVTREIKGLPAAL